MYGCNSDLFSDICHCDLGYGAGTVEDQWWYHDILSSPLKQLTDLCSQWVGACELHRFQAGLQPCSPFKRGPCWPSDYLCQLQIVYHF